MEKLIPISKKQYEQINTLKQADDAARTRLGATTRDLSVYVQPFVDGLEEDLPPANILGARCVDGVYMLALQVLEPPPGIDPGVPET